MWQDHFGEENANNMFWSVWRREINGTANGWSLLFVQSLIFNFPFSQAITTWICSMPKHSCFKWNTDLILADVKGDQTLFSGSQYTQGLSDMFTAEKHSALGLGSLGFAAGFAYHPAWIGWGGLIIHSLLQKFRGLLCFSLTLLLRVG